MMIVPPPPSGGDYPDRFVFDNPGQSVEGLLREIRMTPEGGRYEPCPVMDVVTEQRDMTGNPVAWSVFCNTTSLWRQVHQSQTAGSLIPGQTLVRVTFVGWDGKAKIFQLDHQPANAAAAAPAQGPAPAANGFGPAPAVQAEPELGAGAPAAPWGGAAQAPAAAPWGQ